jgi:hypothetical protein
MGTAVTFSLGAASIAGYAVQDSGGFKEYYAQGLIEATDEVLFFVPSSSGSVPDPGYTLSGFGDAEFVTKRVFPLSPNGTAIAARVVVSK